MVKSLRYSWELALEREEEYSPVSFDIHPSYAYPLSSRVVSSHLRRAQWILSLLLPEEIQTADSKNLAGWLRQNLPVLKWSEIDSAPEYLSLFLLCRPLGDIKTEQFFLEAIRRWLIPHKEVHVASFQNFYFDWPRICEDRFFVAEIKVLIEEENDKTEALLHLPTLAKEIASGIAHSPYASHLLETKVLNYSSKTVQVHQELIRLSQKYPQDFEGTIFVELARLLALSNREFRERRLPRHLTRLVLSFYLLRKHILRSIQSFPEKKHMLVRCLPTRLQFPFATKSVLGLVIGVGIFEKHDLLEEKHVLLAVQKRIAEARVLRESLYTFQGHQDGVRFLYVEIEKQDASRFSLDEIQWLKRELAEELKERIETLSPSVFMIRNAEEVMRNILLLSQQLSHPSDLPQAIISFDSQTATDLTFMVVLVRLHREDEPSIEELFRASHLAFKYIPERVQNVGYLRKKYPKEAHVFRLCIPKDQAVLRLDSSCNFYLARQKVASLLQSVIGEVRDYNGGMILKQSELFLQFKELFEEVSKKNQDLLEDFFFSLNPVEAQATVPLASLQQLFSMFLEASQVQLLRQESFVFNTHEGDAALFVMLHARESSLQEYVHRSLERAGMLFRTLITNVVRFQGALFLGYIYECVDAKQRKQFCEALQEAIDAWKDKLKNAQIARLCFHDLPASLDPRLGGDEISKPILKMLYEGLMRLGEDDKPECAVAQSVEISSDQRQYVFALRECYWSNGERVSAEDFAYTWKKILSPDFPTPFAHLFYPIKNARCIKERKVPVDEVGIHVLSKYSLQINLEHPTPYFLELVAQPIFSPVNHSVDRIHPNWASGQGETYVCNGPFKLKKHHPQSGYELIKNPRYWDQKAVQLQHLFISQGQRHTVKEMLRNGEIEWVDRPVFTDGPLKDMEVPGEVVSVSGGVLWNFFNNQRFPFNHPKMRQAFCHAIDREELIGALSHSGLKIAASLWFSRHVQHQLGPLETNPEKARRLLQEALEELGIKKQELPLFTVIHPNRHIREKAAVELKNQWQRVLEVSCRTEGCDWSTLFAKIRRGDYQIAEMYWRTSVQDQSYTLNAFRSQNTLQFFKWENKAFEHLLDLADTEVDPNKRFAYLAAAEQMILDEGLVVPLFYEYERYFQRTLKGVYYSNTGVVDFRGAYIAPT